MRFPRASKIRLPPLKRMANVVVPPRDSVGLFAVVLLSPICDHRASVKIPANRSLRRKSALLLRRPAVRPQMAGGRRARPGRRIADQVMQALMVDRERASIPIGALIRAGSLGRL